MADRHRTFVAVDLDPALRSAVGALERALETAGIRLRWIKPENLHFTLKFLGEISAAQVARVRAAVREAAGSVQPFQITLESVGTFPNPLRPQVLWVGVGEGRDQLVALAVQLEEHLASRRFPPEGRQFHPHLTLARIRDTRGLEDFSAALERFGDASLGSQVVRALTVYESRLSPSGATYEALEEVPLGTH